jgi:hypothetical protein
MLPRYTQAASIDIVVYRFDKMHHTLKSKGHGHITKCTERSDERCLDLVFYLEGNLVIPRVAIEITYKASTGYGVHNLIDPE